MNTIKAKVIEITNVDMLHIVKFDCNGDTLSMMSLELNANIKIGSLLKLGVKASNIAIAKNFTGKVSHPNILHVKIESIENGELLTSITFSFFDTILEAILTTEASAYLDLKVGDEVKALIKASDLSIKKIVNA